MKEIQKSAFGIFAAVVVLFAAIAVVVARSTSAMMAEEAERTVKGAVRETTLKIDRRLLAVESVMRGCAWIAAEHLDNPDFPYRITRELVRNNELVIGSAIAFEPDFYKEKGRLYAPYSCISTNGEVKSFLLPYDYSVQEWYRVAKESGRARWCEPYFDKGGAETMVCTYSVPLTNAAGRVYAVLSVDLSLARMTERASAICPYPQSYAVIISAAGQYLVLPPQGQTFERGEETITIREKTGNGWTVSIVCPMDAILGGARKLTTVIFVFAGIALLIIIVISLAHSKRLQRESALRERMANELDIAHQIQAAILPKEFPPDVFAALRPARTVGGDLCDFVSRGDKVFFLVGDAAGNGVSAAIFSFVAGMVFRAVCREDVGPAEILGRINEALLIDNEQSLFMTAVAGVFDRKTGELQYGSAGRIPLLVVSPDGVVQPPEAKCQPPLGVSSDNTYAAQAVQVGKGAKVLVFTDGVLNAEGADQVAFGKERVRKFAAGCAAASAAETVNGLLKAVDGFLAGAEPADDLAVLSVER